MKFCENCLWSLAGITYSNTRNSQPQCTLSEADLIGVSVQEVDQVAGDEQQRLGVQHMKVVAQHTVVAEGVAEQFLKF